jgi:hypothetical protein
MAKTIAEAKRQGKDTFTGKDGKEKAAVTREELAAWEKKSGKTGLRAFLNTRNAARKAKSSFGPAGGMPSMKAEMASGGGKRTAPKPKSTTKKVFNSAEDFNNKLQGNDKLRAIKAQGQKKLTPAKVTAKKKLTPVKAGGTRKLTPAKVTAKKKLTPVKAGGTRKLTPAKVMAKRKATPAKAMAKRKATPAKATPVSDSGYKRTSMPTPMRVKTTNNKPPVQKSRNAPGVRSAIGQAREVAAAAKPKVQAASKRMSNASEKARQDATGMARSVVADVKKRVKTAAKKYGYM